MDSFEAAERRRAMVERQIRARGIDDPKVLDAMRTVPRERFVPDALAGEAFADGPLPIGGGQTISQPYVVALMADLARLRPEHRVLEVGTGSGYAAAVLSHLAARVVSVERDLGLARTARERLLRLGYGAVTVMVGDGTAGCPEHAPFDAILVAAGAPAVPSALRNQLAPGGRLVIPVGEHIHHQRLLVVERTPDGFRQEDAGDVGFVPLVGRDGWDSR